MTNMPIIETAQYQTLTSLLTQVVVYHAEQKARPIKQKKQNSSWAVLPTKKMHTAHN